MSERYLFFLQDLVYFSIHAERFCLHIKRSYFFRLKLPSCRSAEDLETRATSTTTKRRTFASHKQKSVQKSLLTFSQDPSRFPRLWDICTLMRVIRWNWGHPVLLTIASFLHSTRLKRGRFFAMPPGAAGTDLHTGKLCRHLHVLQWSTRPHSHCFCFNF